MPRDREDMQTMNLATLPSIPAARLPILYEGAKTALAECSRIDECQDWADKAEALASYAKQAEDESLRQLAERIQARAINRCGQLLRMIESQKGARTDLQPNGGVPTRLETALKAGMSRDQMVTALRVANVPLEDFERQVESANPPTITALAEQGKTPRKVDLGGAPPEQFARATEVIGNVRRFAEFCAKYEPQAIALAVQPRECQALREQISVIDSWLDIFVTSLKG